VRWLLEARRILKPEGTLWVSGTHHIIFSLGFALQRLVFGFITRSPGGSWTSSRTLSTPHSIAGRWRRSASVGASPAQLRLTTTTLFTECAFG
jgi:hypothetical protein